MPKQVSLAATGMQLVPPAQLVLHNLYTCLPIYTRCTWLLQARKFKIINTSTQEANFEIDRKLLERAGFAVSQDKAIKLAGAPEHQSVEVGLTLQVPPRPCAVLLSC